MNNVHEKSGQALNFSRKIKSYYLCAWFCTTGFTCFSSFSLHLQLKKQLKEVEKLAQIHIFHLCYSKAKFCISQKVGLS